MSESLEKAAFGRYGRILFWTCRAYALMGGLLFVGLAALSIVSIVGRKLASSPIPGDVELLQMIAAVASASFFGYCHMNQGDVKVDFFTARLPRPLTHRLDALGGLLVGLCGALLAWRVAAGALLAFESGETSAILGLSMGAAQFLTAPGFALLALAGFYMCGVHWRLARGDFAGENS